MDRGDRAFYTTGPPLPDPPPVLISISQIKFSTFDYEMTVLKDN